MAEYKLPQDLFDSLVEAFGDRQKAEAFEKILGKFVEMIKNEAKETTADKKELFNKDTS